MYNDIIKLVSEVKSVDNYGDMIITRQDRVVFAQLKSIGQSEFYQAQAVGLKPEVKFVLADYLEYQGEKILKYANIDGLDEEFEIIRTYRNNNTLELVCKRGVDNNVSTEISN